MRIKKNGKTINLTESDIRKLSKSLLKESSECCDPNTFRGDDWGAQIACLRCEIEKLSKSDGNKEFTFKGIRAVPLKK